MGKRELGFARGVRARAPLRERGLPTEGRKGGFANGFGRRIRDTKSSMILRSPRPIRTLSQVRHAPAPAHRASRICDDVISPARPLEFIEQTVSQTRHRFHGEHPSHG
jgi:hypothetical protein